MKERGGKKNYSTDFVERSAGRYLAASNSLATSRKAFCTSVYNIFRKVIWRVTTDG